MRLLILSNPPVLQVGKPRPESFSRTTQGSTASKWYFSISGSLTFDDFRMPPTSIMSSFIIIDSALNSCFFPTTHDIKSAFHSRAFKAPSQLGPACLSKDTTFIPKQEGPLPWFPHFQGLHSSLSLAVSHIMGEPMGSKGQDHLGTLDFIHPKFIYRASVGLFFRSF